MSSFITQSQKNLFLKTLLVFVIIINSAFSDTLNKNLKGYTNLSKFQDSIHHTEKVFLHFDKPYYSSGDQIWYKVYLVSADSNRPYAISKIVYVELINPVNKIVISRKIKIENGGGEGEIYLPKRLNAGEYTVRAYTNFMRNFDESYFFIKKIHIGSPSELLPNVSSSLKNAPKKKLNQSALDLKPSIQFFPEGGYMVTSQTSKIGLKALDIYGKGIDVSGSIVDNTGNEIVNFNTLKFGLGIFKFTPKKGKSYKALIEYQGKNYNYNLPDALNEGVTMNVIERKNSYQVYLQSSLPEGVDQLALTGLQNGKIVNVAQLIGSKKRGVINVPKSTLKQGIVQFTIFDKTEKPLCERLVFVETELPEPKVNILTDKKEYTKRELIELDFEIDPGTQTNMSLAVTDMTVVEPDIYGLDIRSHLLLNSELKGEIEQPGYYFQSKDPNRKKMLDLLMMTHGWRQFLWNHEDQNKKEYTHETGIRFKGIVKNKSYPEKPASAEVSLAYSNMDEFVLDKTISSKNGKFQFGDYQFNDSTSVIIQAKNYKVKKKGSKKIIMDYSIFLDTFSPHPIIGKPSFLYTKNNLEKSNESVDIDYMIRSKMERLNSVIPFDDDVEKLDEVTVKHTRIKKEIKEKFKNRQTIYGQPTYRVDFDEIQTTIGTTNVIAAMRGKVPGLRMSGNIDNPSSQVNYVGGQGGNSGNGAPGKAAKVSRAKPVVSSNYSLTIRGGLAPPLILLNNFEVQDFSSIIAEEVSFVDILSPARSAMYGSRGMGGVISIHTKRGNEDTDLDKKDSSGIINFVHPGYYKARKFYEPNYKVEKPEHKKFDYRSTLYWNPTWKLDKKGKAKISFYAADIPTTYRIEIQGITTDGFPIVNETYIDVE